MSMFRNTRTVFNGITDTQLYQLEQISIDVEKRALELQDKVTDTASQETLDLIFFCLQLARVTTMQTQALRAIN